MFDQKNTSVRVHTVLNADSEEDVEQCCVGTDRSTKEMLTYALTIDDL